MNKPNKLIEALFPWVRRKREREDARIEALKLKWKNDAETAARWNERKRQLEENYKRMDAAILERIQRQQYLEELREQARIRPASRRTYQRIR